MFGKTELFHYLIILIAVIAAVTDVFRGKIFNWLTLPAIVLGLIASAGLGGWSGAVNAFLGVFVGFILYSWMFWQGAMGGGDVKLLMALGAWGGLRYVTEVAVLGIFLGGLLAMALLVLRGHALDFVSRMYQFLLTIFVKELKLELPKMNRNLTMPFGVPIAAAAIWVLLYDPLGRWGG